MEEQQINWKLYNEELLSSLSNERIWALGCTNDYNPHLQNIENIEEELKEIDNAEYHLVLSKHIDTPEYFDDYLK